MTKALILVFALIACTFAASPFDQIKDLVQNDECGLHAMEIIRPKLENKIQELRGVNFLFYIEPNGFES